MHLDKCAAINSHNTAAMNAARVSNNTITVIIIIIIIIYL